MTEPIKIGSVDALPPGQRLLVEADDRIIAVFNIDGTYHAIDDLCSHDGGTIADGVLEGHQIECPRHGARFDVRTGKALCMPATEPIDTHHVEARDGSLYLTVNDA